MRIDFLYWEECPSHAEALTRLRTVLREEGILDEVMVTHVDTDDASQALGFPGSPTIRIDGRDIQPEGAGGWVGLTCRLYLLEDGRPSPLPSLEMIRRGVRAAKADTVRGARR